jgi:hypothetical protein
MAFWERDKLPPELRDKKPEEIVAALADAQKAIADKATADAAAADAASKLATQTTEFEQMKTRMVQLEANQKPPIEEEHVEPASPWTDPVKFIDEQTRGTQNVALAAGVMAAKMYFMQNLDSRDQKIFRKYEKEVEQAVQTYQPAARVMPQSWLTAFLYTKGVHEKDIMKAESTGSDFFSETPSRGQQDDPPPQDKLTAEEEAMCDAMHWNKEGYLKQKKQGAVMQGEKGAYARYPVPQKPARS